MPPTTRQLTTEYVVGASPAWALTGLRSLVWAFDDLTQEFGDDLYQTMLLDPVARAVVNTIIASVIEEGMTLSPAVADPATDGYAKAQEIVAFCTSVLNDLATPLDDVLWDMAGAIALGSRVAELVWARSGGLLVLQAVKVKPRRATAFVVDSYLNVRGLVGVQAGSGALAGTVLNTNDVLPREKFFVYSFRSVNGDPRGTSVLRPAYTPWQLKRNLYPEFFKYLAQFGSPSLWASAAEGAPDLLIDGETLTAVQALQQALLAYQNGSVLAVPYDTLIHVLEANVGGDNAFHNAFTHCDAQISMAVLHETLATLEAQHQARASSQVHQDTQQTIIRQIKRGLAGAFRRDVLRPLVAYNYGEQTAADLTPATSLGSVEQNDLASMMSAVAQLARASYLDVSQLPGVDAMLNLPPRKNTPEPVDPAAQPQEDPTEESLP
jgi:phage gp29-like protein